MKLSMKNLLKNKSYLSYFFASALSMGSSNILQFALALYILDMTGSPLIYASILSIIIIPRIILTPIAGVLGDRLRRIDIMKVLNFAQALLMLIYAIFAIFYKNISLIAVYALVILLEMIEVFYNAAENSILAEIIDQDLMEEAVAFSKVDDGIVYVTTPMLAAFIYKQFALSGSFILVCALMSLTFILNFFIKTPFAVKVNHDEKNSFKSYFTDFKDGLLELSKNKFAKVFVVVAPLINFSFDAVCSVIITYVFLEVFKLDEYVYGVYRTITSLVSITLPFIILPVVKKFKPLKLLKYASLSIATCIFLMGAAVYYGSLDLENNAIISVILITVFDCLIISSVMPLNIATQVFFQKNIKDEYRSRILSVLRMLVLSSIPLGNMFYGFLANTFEAYICIFVGSLAVFITYPLILYLSRE